MCGLFGELKFNQSSHAYQALDGHLKDLYSRGPDSQGVWINPPICFGHTRLKIMDLGDESQQPMIDPNLGLAMVFNGAIYNYKELRSDLVKLGYRFFSDGDTEVILKAYHAWGEKCVEQFNGMFAFAIWDTHKRRLFVARDRLGIKPLYFYQDNEQIVFSSFMPALIRHLNKPVSIDPFGLHSYFSFHAIVPAPHTLFKEIKKLEPGHTLTLSENGKTEKRCYWQLNFPQEGNQLEDDVWIHKIKDKLHQSIKRRLIADVPVGIFLSGGVDSSLLVAMANEHTSHQLKTFSIGFNTVGDEEGDEFKYSDIVAKKYQTDHKKFVIGDNDVLKHLPNCIRSMSEPQVSHDAIGFYLLSQFASKEMKVVLSGQGADEVFAGYHWHQKLAQSVNAAHDYANAFIDYPFEVYKTIVNSPYIKDDFSRQFIEKQFAKPGAYSPLQKVLRSDTTIMLVDDPVKRVDNMTMAHSLEARVPFLDHELIEAAAQIPSSIKLKSDGKFILKEIARQYVPSEVIDRKKGYFPVPGLKYISGAYMHYARELISSAKQKNRGILNWSYVDDLLQKDPKDILTPLNGSKLWQVVLLETWLSEQGIELNESQ